MSVWERIGNIQDFFKHGQKSVGPFNSDKKVNFGVTLDIAKSLPNNPTYYQNSIDGAKNQLAAMNIQSGDKNFSPNDAVEKARVQSLEILKGTVGQPAGIAAGAIAGSVIPGVGTLAGAGYGTAAFGLAQLDKETDGKVSKALMAGTMAGRSNYAFVNDISKNNAGLGLLSGLHGLVYGIGGAIAGASVGSLGFGIGAIPGAISGFAAGSAIGLAAERNIAKSGALDKIDSRLKDSANYAETKLGQEQYNAGRDATRAASFILGWKTLGDTNKGIGAVTSGLLNVGLEATTAGDINAIKLAGGTLRGAVVGGVTKTSVGPIESKFNDFVGEQHRTADKLEADIEILKKTGAGEQTVYTPVFKFYRETPPAVTINRPEFKNNELGQVGGTLLFGKSDAEMSLIFRIGRGDATAWTELQAKHADTFAQLARYEGIQEVIETSGTQRVAYGFSVDGRHIAVSKDHTDILEAEIAATRDKYNWLDKSLKLDSALQERTISKIPGVEAFRNDVAKQKYANQLEQGTLDISTRETALGKVMQKVFQVNGLSFVLKKIDRALDDAPHQTINFNDPIQSSTRFRTTARAAINKDLIAPEEAGVFYNSFVKAKNEGEKSKLIDDFTTRIFEQVGNKYGIPASVKDVVLAEWLRLTRSNKSKAQTAAAENKAYMIDDAKEAISDPQLISQLANGGYLPDVELVDKAFKRYAKKKGPEASLPINAAILGKATLDEFQSMWRLLTLARVGFPVNVMRDSTLRTWGDGTLFYSLKNLGEDFANDIANGAQTVKKIENWTTGVINKDKNLGNIRQQISNRIVALDHAKAAIKRSGYDPLKPPKEIPLELQKTLDYASGLQGTINELRRQENALVKNIPTKVVARDKIDVSGYTFPAPFSGRFGEISKSKILGKDDIRGLLASVRELEMANVRRDRDGGRVILATENEDLHLQSWNNVLNNILRNDPVASKIMSGVAEKDVIAWIKSPASGTYLERFGYDPVVKRPLRYNDANYIYNRVLNAVNQFAPEIRLQKLVVSDKANVLELKKMYPDIANRPAVITDLALDLTGNSNMVRYASGLAKDAVAWLATVPTSKLSYSPYFAAKYEQKLQSMVAIANSQGRKLTEINRNQFEANARAYALSEYRQKINAFNRDMNYPGLMNYILAFFPALVEQFRAYGKIAVEHPEFPYKMVQMSQIPNQIGQVKTDQFGNDYVEVTLPLLNLKGRLPTSWFNPINPTGGHVLSSSAAVSASVNWIAQRKDLPDTFINLVLPFGVQSNAISALTPNTLRQGGRLFQAFVSKNGEQFNKDTNMFLEIQRKEFTDLNHRQMTPAELATSLERSRTNSKYLAVLRFLGSGILPLQPQYTTSLQVYSDLLSKYNKEYGADGTDKFVADYPDFFMVADKLTDSTSGLRSDDTAVTLVKKNPSVVENIVASIGEKNLSVLGAVFNDDDYQFSSTAQAWLTNNAIPGTRQKFKEQGAALENNRSSIIKKGWNDYHNLIEIVSLELENNNPPIDPATGYGKSIVDSYKEAFINKAKTDNNLWYNAKAGAGFQNKLVSTVSALTIAANSPELWSDLSKQPRWHTIVEYLNFRYDIYDALQARGTTITSAKAADIKEKADAMVGKLRKEDISFGKFYDIYFDGDTFDDPTLENK